MSRERISQALLSLGLSQTDSRVYLYLATNSPKKAKNIAKALKITKQQLYPTLRNLKNKGILTATSQRPAIYSAISFEKVIEQMIKAKMEQSKAIKENKKNLLAVWRSLEFTKEK